MPAPRTSPRSLGFSGDLHTVCRGGNLINPRSHGRVTIRVMHATYGSSSWCYRMTGPIPFASKMTLIHSIKQSPAINAITTLVYKRLGATSALKMGQLPLIAAVVLLYALLCSSVRYRRVRRKERELKYPDRKSMSKMTNIEAQGIILELAKWEFPTVFKMSLQFALFKVCPIDNPSTFCSH